jgi:hypothetical protein
MKKLLILAPHADDEIFCIPHAKHFEAKGYAPTLFVLSGSEVRYAEARRSCKLLGWSCLVADEGGPSFADGLFHEHLGRLVQDLIEIIKHYSLVLCPAFEGGHQDHDTTFTACLIASLSQTKCVPFFFNTYTAGMGKLFKVFSSGLQSTNIRLSNYHTLKYRYLPIRIVLALLVYRTQLASWGALMPAIMVAALFGKKEVIYTIAFEDYHLALSAILDLHSVPLYQRHHRCTQRDWFYHARPVILQTLAHSTRHRPT